MKKCTLLIFLSVIFVFLYFSPFTLADYTGNEIPIVKIINQTDYTLEVMITEPMIYKGGIVPAGKSALIIIPNGSRVPGTVTVKAIALKDGHLEGDWQETFPVPKSSTDFIPVRTLKPQNFE